MARVGTASSGYAREETKHGSRDRALLDLMVLILQLT
jgi:hypothetical protein